MEGVNYKEGWIMADEIRTAASRGKEAHRMEHRHWCYPAWDTCMDKSYILSLTLVFYLP
jgi:hypothetical protein